MVSKFGMITCTTVRDVDASAIMFYCVYAMMMPVDMSPLTNNSIQP